MNSKVTVTLSEELKMFSSLKFNEKGLTSLKPGSTVTLEETGKIHIDEGGKSHKVLRLRKDTRNYYTFDSMIKS
jgi:hypothetical protein